MSTEEVRVEETVIVRTDYAGNSDTEKEETKEKREVTSVISGKVVDTGKKKWYRRLSESITGDDAKSVVSYVILDVAVPALRDMAFDIVKEGAQRAFYGEATPRNSRSTRSGAVRTNYGAAYKTASGGGEPIRKEREMSKRARSTHDFREIAYENRADVEMVMDELLEAIRDYGEASVADYYKLSEIEPTWADNRWGWTEANDIGHPRRTRDGWMLELNAPRELTP